VPKEVSVLRDREKVEAAAASCRTIGEALVQLGLRAAGGNYRRFREACGRFGVEAPRYDHAASMREVRRRQQIPLKEILVENSTYSRSHLKERLYDAGLKQPVCEICGQDENWMGRRLSLILDHINGVFNDNRLHNLRILCPNCNATLDTHCGKHRRAIRRCSVCGRRAPSGRRTCSDPCLREAYKRRDLKASKPRPGSRKVKRPSRARLTEQVARHG
jgi:hypothetical protein